MSADTKKQKPGFLDSFLDRIFGPDDDDQVDDALDAEDEREGKVASLKKLPDFTVEVFWDEEAESFRARMKTKFMPETMELSVEGDTPGEALSLVAMTLDNSLARRGFRRARQG